MLAAICRSRGYSPTCNLGTTLFPFLPARPPSILLTSALKLQSLSGLLARILHSHNSCHLTMVVVPLRLQRSDSPLVPSPFSYHSASVAHPTSPKHPSPFIRSFKGYPSSLMRFHVSGSLTRFSTIKGQSTALQQPTKHFLLFGPYPRSAWFVYDITRKSQSQ